jgi:putative ABC transport system permease protein
MIRHLFLIIWNQKRRNFGLILEIFFSFLVLFAVLTFILNKYNYYRQPLGFEYENVWTIYQDTKGAPNEEVFATQEQIKNALKSFPEVINFTFSNTNIPYGSSRSITSLRKGDKEIDTDFFRVDQNFANTLGMSLSEGRWFNESDRAAGYTPIIINGTFKKEAFGEEPAAGQFVEDYNNNPLKVIGVVDQYKYRGEFLQPFAGYFQQVDTSYAPRSILLHLRNNADAEFEERLNKRLDQIASNWSFQISYLDEMRKSTLRETKIPMLIFIIISAFLVFNVALGLFGVLWYNINKRKQEIGIRRAMGASQSGIGRQFVGEVLVISTLSLALGTFFAVQFPLLQVFDVQAGVYLLSTLTSIVLIYLIAFSCSLYPSVQAAKLQPAVALHDE